ncbi:transmembrane protein 42 [Thrips palmi]|uniref:Transmembrane protein 42 n=1 Tax=Thrips palmi TaxID=161013 RepID=A0A6P8YTG9_THRPL|nr:transmembrane protein 42 [Thrips palmi]
MKTTGGFFGLSGPFAALSGVAAASASVFGKLFSSAGSPWLGAVLIACMVVSNGLVWTLFVRALRSSQSSLTVTVTSAAVNYCCSALFGWLLFSERTSALWWLGSGLVVAGLLLMNSGTPNPDALPDDKQD